MDEFLYRAELARLQTFNTSQRLIKQMGLLTSQYVNVLSIGTVEQPLSRLRSYKSITLKGLSVDDLDFQITTIYTYALYLATRDRYFELKLNINKLPQYALWDIPYIDIDKTIQYLRIKHDITRNRS